MDQKTANCELINELKKTGVDTGIMTRDDEDPCTHGYLFIDDGVCVVLSETFLRFDSDTAYYLVKCYRNNKHPQYPTVMYRTLDSILSYVEAVRANEAAS